MKSLQALQRPLALPSEQLRCLNGSGFDSGQWLPFQQRMEQSGQNSLAPNRLDVMQLNLGYMCNQVCKHCHVDAGPDRREVMSQETMSVCLNAMERAAIKTLDLTGGAPEMNPHFRWLVEQAAELGIDDIIVRCNLTIILANKKYHDLPEFFAKHGVHVVSSLPYYEANKTDRQRGQGVFGKSIEALKMLNGVGYGSENSKLRLDLVYNPAGAFLPNNQMELEQDFKRILWKEHNILFNQLFAITNMPISRYLEYLIDSENFDEYMELLVQSFNPLALQNVMCRNTMSVGYDGSIYDCDFNQMLQLKSAVQQPTIFDWNEQDWNKRKIVVANHCFGCTAGAGSSCQGSLTNE
jgi:radical SAM/Cys-rich protein